MSDGSGRYWIVFNGEIYNYLELQAELKTGFDFRTRTDSEVLLAAYIRWNTRCLDHLIGMFAFAIWDEQEQVLFAARDRFGVKPLYHAKLPSGQFALASEIKTLHALGVPRQPDAVAWATYLAYGLYDHCERTFWQGIESLTPGHALQWQGGELHVWRWYNLVEKVGDDWDERPDAVVMAEYRALLEESVRLRFRADVPVGINLSGGLDSSTLLGLIHAVQGSDDEIAAFTFVTGDVRYDELPWVRQMLAYTHHPHYLCQLTPAEVPDLAVRVHHAQDEPFGGLPTLAYAKVFEKARHHGTLVLLDGQGLDEQWAGYDYYAFALNEAVPEAQVMVTGPIQGSYSRSVRPECLRPEFRALADPYIPSLPFADRLRNYSSAILATPKFRERYVSAIEFP